MKQRIIHLMMKAVLITLLMMLPTAAQAEDSVEYMSRILTKNTEGQIRASAASLLGKYHNPTALRALCKARSDADPKVTKAVKEALAELASRSSSFQCGSKFWDPPPAD